MWSSVLHGRARLPESPWDAPEHNCRPLSAVTPRTKKSKKTDPQRRLTSGLTRALALTPLKMPASAQSSRAPTVAKWTNLADSYLLPFLRLLHSGKKTTKTAWLPIRTHLGRALNLESTQNSVSASETIKGCHCVSFIPPG